MGVPSYFHWLVTRFEDQILIPAKLDKEIRIDNLYLDLNCAIHPAVKKPGLKRENMFKAVGEYIDDILDTANPRKILYIAIDGVAPRAKMQQQRKRRFKSVQDSRMITEIKRKHGVAVEKTEDFNMISPGTVFMEGLSKYLTERIAAWKNGRWRHLQIIFSDANVPGEGEHKIMDHIRDHSNPEDQIAIYGLDSDLIFLCLANYHKNSFLLREQQQFGPKFKCGKGGKDIGMEDKVEYVYLSMDILREKLLGILNPYVSLSELESQDIFNKSRWDNYTDGGNHNKKMEEMLKKGFYKSEEEQQNIIMDYIFISFLLGNDFLPHAPSLKIREGGLDQVLRVYKMVQLHKHSYLLQKRKIRINVLNENGMEEEQVRVGYFGINMEFLKDFLYQLKLLEEPMLQNQTRSRHHRIENFYKSRKYMEAANDYEREVLELEYVENKSKDLIQLGYDGWKDRYYEHHFNIENRNVHEFRKNVGDICYNVFEGMIWTLHYYQNTCVNWDWCYDHHSAPAVSDLFESLPKINLNTIRFSPSLPATPLEQLMSILPAGSSHLLPTHLARLMHDLDSPVIYFYPRDFELDILNTRYRWEAHPLLPKIDTDRLKSCIKVYNEFK